MGYLTISTNVRRYQTHHRWQSFSFRKIAHRCIVCNTIQLSEICGFRVSVFCYVVQKHKLLALVERLLIAYFISNISAKKSKSIHVCQSYSKPKVGRFLRHGVLWRQFCHPIPMLLSSHLRSTAAEYNCRTTFQKTKLSISKRLIYNKMFHNYYYLYSPYGWTCYITK